MSEVGVPGRSKSRMRRVAAWMVLAALVSVGLWRAEDAGWFDARAVAVSDETARAMLSDVAKWDAATSGERRGVAERVERSLSATHAGAATGGSSSPEFTLLRVRSFGFDGHHHEIAVFAHAATGMEFSLIPGGTFRMGSPEGEAERESDETQHEVRLTHAFLLSRTECTQAAYERVMGTNPSTGTVAPDHPVETVSWDEVRSFNAKTGLRLPSEAEWEFACRAGTTTRFWSGDSEEDLTRVAWIAASGSRWDDIVNRVRGWVGMKPPAASHHPVAWRPSNPFGLWDMHGNVWEWCADGYAAYSSGPVTDPTGTEAAPARVCRGGGWRSPAWCARSALRDWDGPGSRYGYLGFRPARSVPSE
ncbi:MAG: formylglycine-generating enzyme family protein [Planctomycetes bacterium]|nr:formylglycine-generating enzyme family protein [Planctomycetota bacterium]